MPIPNTKGTTTIEALLELFSGFGIITHIVSDNGLQLISSEFSQLTRYNGI